MNTELEITFKHNMTAKNTDFPEWWVNYKKKVSKKYGTSEYVFITKQLTKDGIKEVCEHMPFNRYLKFKNRLSKAIFLFKWDTKVNRMVIIKALFNLRT